MLSEYLRIKNKKMKDLKSAIAQLELLDFTDKEGHSIKNSDAFIKIKELSEIVNVRLPVEKGHSDNRGFLHRHPKLEELCLSGEVMEDHVIVDRDDWVVSRTMKGHLFGLEEVEFLMNLSKRLNTQDNRITADPIFQVRDKVRVYGLSSDYSDKFIYVSKADSEDVFEMDYDKQDVFEFLKVWGS